MRFILKFLDKLVGVFLALWSRTLIAYELFRIAGVVVRSIKELKFVLNVVLGAWHWRILSQYLIQTTRGKRVNKFFNAIIEIFIDFDALVLPSLVH